VKLFTALFLSLVAVFALTMFMQSKAASSVTHTIAHVATGEVIANPMSAAIMFLVSCLIVASAVSTKAGPFIVRDEKLTVANAGYRTEENEAFEVGWRSSTA